MEPWPRAAGTDPKRHPLRSQEASLPSPVTEGAVSSCPADSLDGMCSEVSSGDAGHRWGPLLPLGSDLPQVEGAEVPSLEGLTEHSLITFGLEADHF